MVKLYYAYEEMLADTKALIASLEGRYDALLVVARGGMSFAHLLAEGLDIRDLAFISLASYDDTVQRESVTVKDFPVLDEKKRYLIVEDIIDSGKSMMTLTDALKRNYPNLNYDVAALFCKKSALYQPKYYLHEATTWIDFFWSADI